jgi:hypothetical protein
VGYPPEISTGPEEGSLSMAGVSDRESVSVFGAHVAAVLVAGNRSARLIPAPGRMPAMTEASEADTSSVPQLGSRGWVWDHRQTPKVG